MHKVLRMFGSAEGATKWKVLLCLILANLVQGIGIASLVPLIAIVSDQGSEEPSAASALIWTGFALALNRAWNTPPPRRWRDRPEVFDQPSALHMWLCGGGHFHQNAAAASPTSQCPVLPDAESNQPWHKPSIRWRCVPGKTSAGDDALQLEAAVYILVFFV